MLCPGCGSLRALHHLLHGHVIVAFRFNPVLVPLIPILLCWALVNWLRKTEGQQHKFAPSKSLFWVLLSLVLVFTVWRNIPGTLLATLPQ